MNTLMRSNNNPSSLIENSASAYRFVRDMNQFFSTTQSAISNIPAINVVDHQDGFRIDVAAPGLKKENFKLNLNSNNLTISGYWESKLKDKPEDESKNCEQYTRREFSYSLF